MNISLDEATHIYNINGDTSYMSVTTWNHKHFEKFNADKIISNMMNSRNWANNKYFGMSAEEIKKLWDNNGLEASTAGTKMHYDIECFYNDCPQENDSIEYSYFLNFIKDFPDLVPYRTEWIVWHEDYKLAGSIDMLFENPDGSLDIYDWKRSKGIIKTTGFNKWAKTDCIEHLPDTNYWHYALQLNHYKAILEDKYGKTINKMYLVCLHPNNNNKNYQRIEVCDLQNEVKLLLNSRLK